MKYSLIIAGVLILLIGGVLAYTTYTRDAEEVVFDMDDVPPYPDNGIAPLPTEPPDVYTGPSNDELTFSTTESGLQYAVISEGESEERPSVEDVVEVHYHGTLADGTVFDSSFDRGEPIQFPLEGLIPGWQEGIPLMTVGSTYRFIIPAALAYGEDPDMHPLGGETLTFDVELIDML